MRTPPSAGGGWSGRPRSTFETDPHLKKGEFRCKASLVEGAEKVEPVPASAASLVVHEDGESRTVVLASDVDHDRPPARVPGHDQRQGRVATTRADPSRERHVRPHRSRLHERHPPERPDDPDARAGGRRPDHDRHDDAGVPRGLRRDAVRALGVEVRPVRAAVPVRLALDALGRARTHRGAVALRPEGAQERRRRPGRRPGRAPSSCIRPKARRAPSRSARA